jgi:hypothetical protein
MEIKRRGAHRDRGWTFILDETPVTAVKVSKDNNIEVWFQRHRTVSGAHNVVVTLTSDDLGKIIAEAFKLALSKDK